MAEKREQLLIKSKQIVIENDLPQTDVALYGIRCPYCGKSDRIRELESPEKLFLQIDSKQIQAYILLWETTVQPNEALGVCKFCQNLIKLNGNDIAEPLLE